MYRKYVKRILDFVLSLCAFLVLSPLLLTLSVIGAVKMRGNPFFMQRRPGRISKRTGQERIFCLIKFRTMSNAKDAEGNLLPDEERINGYGKFLRSTSLDELPELLNIIKGDMSIIGPRPQLVRDMVFMTEEQRRRHIVRPGLSGLAQVNGRNAIRWEDKLNFDLKYIKKITFSGDLLLLFRTIGKVFKREDINREGTVSDMDFGDWLLQEGKVSKEEYDKKQDKAKNILIKG